MKGFLVEPNFIAKGFQNLEHCRQTDTQTNATENITMPHSWVVEHV